MTRARLQAITQLTAAFGTDAPALNSIVDVFAAHKTPVDGASMMTGDVLKHQFLISEESSAQFDNAFSHACHVAGQLAYPQLSVIFRGERMWPAQVDCHPVREMTPWLMVLGKASLLSEPAVTIGGSRRATSKSVKITGNLVRELVRRDVVIVSGGASGIDEAAHRSAINHGGRTVVVLAQGLGTFSVPQHWWELIDGGRLAIVSAFSPVARWESWQALQRNAFMARLSGRFVVVQAEEMSGSLSAGRSALRLNRPLHVIVQTGIGAERFRGNEILIANGGIPRHVDVDATVPSDIIKAMLETCPEPGEAPGQLQLI